ncbi:MAG: LLM class flavin-dependent oxidoreductase, partial [Acetobacteraceae bacterium]|nr:LLM class flavin-dependent oxidoreductase [Acetobacteraceae bacterium]
AARIGDAWLIVNATGLRTVEAQMRIYREALAEAGRTPLEYPIARECYVGANHNSAFQECRTALEYKYNAYASWGMESPTAKVSFEEFARDRFIIGDAQSVEDEVARYREALGVDHFIMRVQWPGLEQDKVLGSIRRLGQIFA